jgi:diacylglycerol kinase (ATP)
MKYLFILNPISGPINQPFNIINSVDRIFKSSGHYYEFALTTGPGDAKQIAKEAVRQKFDYVVAAGGDGTVNEVGTALINTDVTLGVIPLGSGNGIARSMNIPLKMDKSLLLLREPAHTHIDVGQANNYKFIGVCGFGFDANIGQKFQNYGARGPVPYFLIGIREFLSYKPEHLGIQIDHNHLSINAFVVAVANTQQYGNGAIIAPHADPGDGLFDLCIVQDISFSQAIRLSIKLFNGTIDRSREYQHYRTKKLTINFDSDNKVIHTDGEPLVCKTPLRIQLIPQALKVCAPGGYRIMNKESAN